MSQLAEVLGSNLRQGDNEVATATVLKDSEFIGLYFGAHFAPPCRLFTTVLTKFYDQVKEDGSKFEVVFVSFDGNNDAFERNFALMPWTAVSYAQSENIEALKQRYGANKVPMLVILDNEGNLISYEGRQEIVNNSTEAFKLWQEVKDKAQH